MTISALLCDSREPQWVKDLQFGGIPVSVTQLDYGDIWATCDDGALIAIERKEPDDFLNTLKEDRLFAQLAGLRGVTPWSYLIITGSLSRGSDGKVISDRGITGWSWSAVQGALITAQELGVVVTYAGGDADYEGAVLRLGNRKHDGQLIIPPTKLPKILTSGEQILAALPGIGLEKAITLLDTYGTPAAALAALTNMTAESAPGIGPVTKTNIRKALGIESWGELAVIMTGHRLEIEERLGIRLDTVPMPVPDIREEVSA